MKLADKLRDTYFNDQAEAKQQLQARIQTELEQTARSGGRTVIYDVSNQRKEVIDSAVVWLRSEGLSVNLDTSRGNQLDSTLKSLHIDF